MQDLLKALRSGGIVIYPTETLYAVGCDATSEEACLRIGKVKGRPDECPLPLIIGGMDMLGLVTAEQPKSLISLAKAFWPGPLSILVKALPELPGCLSDEQGYTSVRWSGHPFASELSRRLKKPIVATSANISGKPPVALPEDIAPDLLEMVDAAYMDPPWPRGHKPSTVVRILGSDKLEILREGEVSIKKLCDKGFSVAVKGL
ncbi:MULTISPECIES: L-threonylcarbamoyladenylate synthase [unclassified Pseudodesulfovibrio]|uniref:L-threonylcarbamoyladenylate synthase n=1 Tax=unclassified Pseudodesulfovibrio TaxID=2661612 RepID=UPI000FEB8FCE|nr:MULTISPECIES: L-threonylcarbamoyladenylate synthase [unclassified Pseudodesulfovibrio]MCJ2163010.1 L-threonylcarbamoyladenylate synthase [Pseudodesulfovibrio sp. S3-i]RWU07006.1 threonylcarbamoyl-AMP synthase [Pseudodesulfovibrio sp. S3]